AVGNAVERVARGDGGGVRLVHLRLRQRSGRPAGDLLLHPPRPRRRDLQPRVVVGRRAGEEAVEVLAEAERHRQAFAAAGGAAVPVIARRLLAEIDLRQLERPLVLLVDALDEEIVERAGVELVRFLDDREGRATRGVSRVGVRADVAGVGGRGDGAQVALQAAAADVAYLAVPGALHAAGAAVCDVQRKPDADADALVLSHRVAESRAAAVRVDEIRFAARRVRSGGREELCQGKRRRGAWSGERSDGRGERREIGAELSARHLRRWSGERQDEGAERQGGSKEGHANLLRAKCWEVRGLPELGKKLQ